MEELFLLSGRPLGDDLFQRVDPLLEAAAQLADRPIASKDDSVRPELVQAEVDDWGQVVRFPNRFWDTGDDAGDFTNDILQSR